MPQIKKNKGFGLQSLSDDDDEDDENDNLITADDASKNKDD